MLFVNSLCKKGVKACSIVSEFALRQQIRSMSLIAPGTSMLSSVIHLEKARPWYNSASEGSNLASDNAVRLTDIFKGKTVALFGVPAPFTGTCTNEHYPGYKKLADELLDAGCDEIICYSVSDPYAHHGWQLALKNDTEKIKFFADPEATFAKAYGVDRVYDKVSLGTRSERFSMIVVDGNVAYFKVVDNAAADAEQLLEELREIKDNKEFA
jgi:peroxiredoxin